MFKNTMLFKEFKLKCSKTHCFSMISDSNVQKHTAFQWFQAQMFKNTMLFKDFSHNTCCLWASLTCSPEHTARQCRNLTFPAGSVKRHRCRCCRYCTPLFPTRQYIIACIGEHAHIHYSVHKSVHIHIHYSMHRLNMHIYIIACINFK
jgi:hypothetical protein